MAKPIELTDASFEQEVLKSSVPVLVDFWAVWCGPCKMIAPSVEQIAGEYEGKLKVGKVDVDVNQATAAKYMVRSIPTLLIFKDGKQMEQIIGAVPKDHIVKKLNSVLS